MQHTLFIRDSVILTINWQQLGLTVAVERSCPGSRVIVLRGKVPIAVMTLIKCKSVVAKLIETSTDVVASGSLVRSEGGCSSVPPPPQAPNPKSWATFPPL